MTAANPREARHLVTICLHSVWLESLTEPGPLSQPPGLQKGRLRPRTRTRSGPGSDPESPCLGPLQKSALIKLANIRAAEKVEEKSFGSSHVMQVIYEDDAGKPQTMYLQCKCVNELNQWLSALRKVCISNPSLLGSYHPGVFRGDKWSCCHQKDKSDLGCDKTRSRVTLQEWNDPLDHDLEAQLIYRHLLGVEAALREKHRELSAGTGAGSVCTGPGEAPEDPLAQLLQVLQDLQEAHSSSPAGSRPSGPNRPLALQT
nr:ras GTPase-activating protein 4B [Mirounga angustirostris]